MTSSHGGPPGGGSGGHPSGTGTFASPPDSRRPSDEESERLRQLALHSQQPPAAPSQQTRLPSLHEALGERPFHYVTPPSTANPASQAVAQPLLSPTHGSLKLPKSLDDQHGSPHGVVSRSMSDGMLSLGQQQRVSSSHGPDSRPAGLPSGFGIPSISSFDSPQSATFGGGSRNSISSQHGSATPSSYSTPQFPSPLASNFDRPALPFHPSGASVTSNEGSSALLEEQRLQLARGWDPNKRQQPPKRRMDNFDVDSHLAIVEQNSSDIYKFSNHYRRQFQQAQQYGANAAPLPSLTECDDMLARQRQLLDSLTAIRDVIGWQTNPNDPGLPLDAARPGALQADSKKRRPRAAPPGRCHSCNRAETPEWRRGPDGARTLCNACGLHFAKAERKNNAKAAAALAAKGSSTGGEASSTKEASPSDAEGSGS